MPPLPRGYEPLPYAGAPRSVPNYGTLGELMGLKARNSQQGWMQLASAFDRFVQSRRAQEQAQLERADVMAQRQSAEAMKREEIALRAAEREEAARMRREAAEEKAQLAAEKRGDSRAKAIGYGPMAEADVDTVMQSPERAGDVRYSFGPGTADGPELQPTQDQRKMIALEQAVSAQGGLVTPGGSVHMPPKPEPKRYGAPMRMADGTWKQFEAGQIPPDAKFWQEPKAPPATRQPIWVINAKGEFEDLAGVAPPGSKPSSSKEQGRPVTSGDAGRVTDLDTSLDDVSVLRGAITETGATGTTSAIGAAVPNWVTEYTGWGSDAKKKQALIDRVKQVIGKALEEGVLRKEDERKYEKILPTIKDPNELVISKLNGLEDSLKKRKQRHLDSLADAGYDISNFASRAQVSEQAPATVPTLEGVREGFSRTFRTGQFAGQEWALVNGQPKRIK